MTINIGWPFIERVTEEFIITCGYIINTIKQNSQNITLLLKGCLPNFVNLAFVKGFST